MSNFLSSTNCLSVQTLDSRALVGLICITSDTFRRFISGLRLTKDFFIGRQNGFTGNATFSKAQTSAQVEVTRQTKKHQASVIPPLLKAFGPTFLFSSLLKLAYDLLAFVSPVLLKLLIDFVSHEKAVNGSSNTAYIDAINDGYAKEPLWHGIFFAVLLFATAGVQSLILAQQLQLLIVVALRIRTALIGSIYKKALCLSNSARKESPVGEIVNLMAVGEFWIISPWLVSPVFSIYSKNVSFFIQ